MYAPNPFIELHSIGSFRCGCAAVAIDVVRIVAMFLSISLTEMETCLVAISSSMNYPLPVLDWVFHERLGPPAEQHANGPV